MQNTPNSAIGLTINLMSFSIPPKIILETDQVRVQIKTIPDGIEQTRDTKGEKMGNCGLIFAFNITNKTETLEISFLKKTILSGNPTVGNASLDIGEIINLPIEGPSCIKKLDIYYPIERQLKEIPRGADRSSIKEKVIGQARLAISLSDPKTESNQKIQRRQSYSGDSSIENLL